MTDSNNSISRRQALAGMVAVGAAAAASRPVEAQVWGRVFIFNTAPEVVQLELNRRALPAIVGTEREDYYIPDVISIDRTALLPDLVVGEFAARNRLQVQYPDGAVTYQIDVDASKYELKRDLLLYVHRDGLIMLHDGTNISENVQKIS
ncbi:MAG: hypothetical protein GKS00_20980 [Alphaproteobacteria bacterium]|nr:hypothetical protein [Alphaproteobacteria bacterium]